MNSDEKEYLRKLVEKELKIFKEEEKTGSPNARPGFLKAAHEYGHFLEGILEKLK